MTTIAQTTGKEKLSSNGFSKRPSFRDGPVEAKGEEEEAKGVALLYPPFARDLCWTEQKKDVAREAQVTVPVRPGATRRISTRKQDLSV